MTKPSLPSLKPVVTNVASTSFNLSPSKWVTHSWRRMLNSSSSLRGELAYQDLSASPPRQGASYESTISHRAAVLVLFVPDCFCRGAENEPFKDCPDFRPSQDLQRATAFYRDTLELKIIVSTPVISIAECGGVFLLISKAETPELDHPSSVIYFDVDDIQKTTADLSSRNVKIDDKPHIVGQLGNQDVWVAIFRDSEDNLVGLISRTPRK